MTEHTKGRLTVESLDHKHGMETNHWYALGCTGGTGRVAKIEGFGDNARTTAERLAAAYNACRLDQLERLDVGRLVEAARTAEAWLTNCVPIVEPTTGKPLPLLRAALGDTE